jgi:hypothetical protein
VPVLGGEIVRIQNERKLRGKDHYHRDLRLHCRRNLKCESAVTQCKAMREKKETYVTKEKVD